MKKRIALLVSVVLLLSFSACSQEPKATDGGPVSDLTYNINDYEGFWQIFDENDSAQWEAMGQYTMSLEGFSTPVTVEMDGFTVLAVTAYGCTADVNIGQFEGEVNAEIQEYQGAILVNEWCDYRGNTWIFTQSGRQEYHPDGEISTQIYVDDEGALRYTRYWGEYQTTFAQSDTAPIDCCTSRDDFLYESGRAQIVDGSVVLTMEASATVSDLYDLDAIFEEAKAAGMYAQYNTVDKVLEANRSKAAG